ncbi:hypothetical protein ACHAWF_004834 [Thalassiosira exigua]
MTVPDKEVVHAVETPLADDEPAFDVDVDDVIPNGDGEAAFAQFAEGTEVAKGKHVVPPGVAVEPLKNYDGHKDLVQKCPASVKALLEERDLLDVYDKFVTSVAETKATRQFMGKWRDARFVSVLDLFRDDFAEKGVKVAFCRRKSADGTFRWLEFIDMEKVGDSYVPQYDVANLSGQVIKTYYHKLEFPNGVAVEELKSWGGRKKLKEKIPIYVETMLKEHDLMEEYKDMVDRVVAEGVGNKIKSWNIEKLKVLMDEYKPIFEAKGLDIYVCHKQEWVTYTGKDGHMEHYRWIEFVDREKQPTYHPQRDANEKKANCSIM